jgi:arabinoxylan arabinofuranohydrolase
VEKIDLKMNKELPIKAFATALIIAATTLTAIAQKTDDTQDLYTGNPIVPNIGLDDGHMRIYGDKIYNYACHDYSPDSSRFILKMWWVWSTTDLLTWTFESSLSPTILGFPEGYERCWATDALSRNGKYYWYLCNPDRTYVVVADSPIGPWESPLGSEPLMEGRDPGVFMDDDGKAYLLTGVWDYSIAELGEDMISLAEEPKNIEILNPRGPYNHDGKNSEEPTDDKPYLHKHKGKYYLSWGCYYAMSDFVYGPYTYKGCFIVEDRTDPEFRGGEAGLTHDRHGSFFQWNNQSYFNCNDLSSNGAHKFWRNTIIMYIHYRDNGEIEPVYINRIGVGQYDAAAGPIEAENYYKAVAAEKHQNMEDGFELRGLHAASSLVYSNVMNLSENCKATFRIWSENPGGGLIEVWSEGDESQLLGTCEFPETRGKYKTVKCRLKNKAEKQSIRLVFKGAGSELLRLDRMSFN